MREWSLKQGDPLVLTLACDARLRPTDYYNDQIWELSLGRGDPPALALETTYGLRAKALRLFPRFNIGDTTYTDPTNFSQPPVIKQIFPNFVSLEFSPFPDIDVEAEYWVPESHGIAGRLQIINNGTIDRQIRVEWVGQLTPTEGQRMAPIEMQATNVLSGNTGELAPVIFLTSGPKPGTGPYPSLMLTMDLSPNSSRQFTWAHAALFDQDESFALARDIASRNWAAERSHLEMLNAGHVDIYTGDADWDTAFMLGQKLAIGLFVGPTQHLAYPSFVLTRQPDQGYSLGGDGSDYNHLWNGQTPLEAYYLANLILPIAPDLVKGLLCNFLAVQTEDGFIDWKPGLAGQRSRLMAPPLLANLAWRLYEISEETSFLEEVFPGLLKFLQAWFTPKHDRDGDGIPEWDHPMQSGAEDHPVYSRWHYWSQGVDITTAESTSLSAYLYRECQMLMRIAKILEDEPAISILQTLAENLKTAVENAWDADAACYFDWDRDAHYSTAGEWLGANIGSGTIAIQREFEHPVRLLVQLRIEEGTRRHPLLFVHGTSVSGKHRVERISDEQFNWNPGLGRLTGKYVYTSLEQVEVQGLEPDDQITLSSVNYKCQDHSLLAPLWAGIPSEKRAKKLVEGTITDTGQFWHPYGLPACTRPPATPEALVCGSVNLPWNLLVGEGLIRYGFRAQAAELVSRLMKAIVKNLKRERAFRRYYQADSGQGVGERNALNGLPPLGLFLEVLGVRLISPNRVALSGMNPFPWPVTVKYRGLTVMRQKDKSIVIFPDGQTVNITDPSPRIVSLETAQG